ncbi:hypothetical protein M422DRAFT_252167 [Sphaerobolus stellatus SS14]|uniref:Uncharacterized protein n=1 Tax=Sphaerobolus stellatus (strain SS14) TaxID=990650 RepID=A0A0C9W0W0_SPHS4|nr:hypothetical protein M422DRAFT_252167 [Sphaerobolus stellatus SS14]
MVNGILNLNNISEGFLLAGQHRHCAFQMFVQEKENSIRDIKLDQDAWARHKLFGNDDAPPPQMKGPVTLTSADDPAGNEPQTGQRVPYLVHFDPNALGAIMNHLELVEYGVIKLASWICPWVWTKPNSKGQPYHLKCASWILLDALTKVRTKEEAVNYLFDIHGSQLIPFSELVNKYLKERNINIRNLSKYAAQQCRVRMKESWGPEKYSIFWDWLKTVFQHFSQSNKDEEFIPLEYFEEMFPPSLQDDCMHTLRHLICSKTFPLIKLIVLNKKSPAYIQDMILPAGGNT